MTPDRASSFPKGLLSGGASPLACLCALRSHKARVRAYGHADTVGFAFSSRPNFFHVIFELQVANDPFDPARQTSDQRY